jgi:hypothetical protein
MSKNKNCKKKNTSKFNEKKSKLTEQTVTKEIGGPKGPEPTRYGDWEVKGRVSDF